MTRTVDDEQLQHLRAAIRETIQALGTLERELPSSAEALYQGVPRITDGLLDALYEALRNPEAGPQELFPVANIPPVLYATERQALIDAAQTIRRSGAELTTITSDAAELTGQRAMGPHNAVTALLKAVLASVCTLSDFTFPTRALIPNDGKDVRFRVRVDDDLEYIVE